MEVIANFVSRPNTIQVNDPRFEAHAENKLRQLEVASRVGFLTPDTLVTTELRDAKAFLKRYGSCVTKSLRSPIISVLPGVDERASPGSTVLLTSQDVDLLDEGLSCPILLQEHLKLRHELRVTVVGDSVLAARIDRASVVDGYVDIRTNIAVADMCPYLVSDSQRERFLGLRRAFSLEYYSADFLLDDSGELFFLDLNPAGQYLWIEDKVPELEISSALVDLLVGSQVAS